MIIVLFILAPAACKKFDIAGPKAEFAAGDSITLHWRHVEHGNPFGAKGGFDYSRVIKAAKEASGGVVTGDEPSHRWKTYSRLITALLAESDVEMVIAMGAFIGRVAHTRPIPIIGVATDPDLLVEHNLPVSSYEGPTGIVGVMLEACREVGIPAVSLWAATPHYLAANPNPNAMLALLDRAASVAGVDIDTTELAAAAAEFQSRVDAALEHNDEFAEYVRQLEDESVVEPVDPAFGGDMLVTEIEDFLRDRD